MANDEYVKIKCWYHSTRDCEVDIYMPKELYDAAETDEDLFPYLQSAVEDKEFDNSSDVTVLMVDLEIDEAQKSVQLNCKG